MKNWKNDPSLAALPAPVTLTLEQLATVAADTGAGLGGGLLSYVVAGGIRVGPPDVTSPTLIKPSDTGI